MEIVKIKKTLKPIFKKYEDILLFSYLFGSVVQENDSFLSDIDIAVYFKQSEKKDYFNHRMLLYADITRKLKRNDVDILVLNTAKNMILLDNILRNNIVLFEKDKDARFDFECRILHQCLDFKHQRKVLLGA